MDDAIPLLNLAAAHPMRRRLPPPVELVFDGDPMSDKRLFALTFCAGFLAVYTFLI